MQVIILKSHENVDLHATNHELIKSRFFYGSSHSIAHFGGLNSIEAPLMLSLAHSKVALVLGGFEEATDTLRRTWGL